MTGTDYALLGLDYFIADMVKETSLTEKDIIQLFQEEISEGCTSVEQAIKNVYLRIKYYLI